MNATTKLLNTALRSARKAVKLGNWSENLQKMP